jgi:hypothetical protein
MHWKITTDDTDVEFTTYEIINLLTAKVIDKERPDHEEISRTFVEYLQSNSALTDISNAQLSSMAFELGYFYRIMHEKNTVEVIEGVVNEPSVDSSV